MIININNINKTLSCRNILKQCLKPLLFIYDNIYLKSYYKKYFYQHFDQIDIENFLKLYIELRNYQNKYKSLNKLVLNLENLIDKCIFDYIAFEIIECADIDDIYNLIKKYNYETERFINKRNKCIKHIYFNLSIQYFLYRTCDYMRVSHFPDFYDNNPYALKYVKSCIFIDKLT